MTNHKVSLLEKFPGRGCQECPLPEEGYPTRKNEAWHYTPLHVLDKIIWQEASALKDDRVVFWLDSLSLPSAAGQLVFANGKFVQSHSVLPEGVTEKTSFTSCEVTNGSPFTVQLNDSFKEPGLDLHVPENCHVGTVILLSLHEGDDVSTHLRHKISLGKGASLTLLEINLGKGRYLSNPVFEIECAESAHFTHVKEQSESRDAYHLAHVSASISRKAVYESFTLHTGGSIARHEVRANLQGEQAVAHINAVQIVSGESHHDLTSLIHHTMPHCQSRQTVRTVLSDKGTGVFQGKVLVDQNAQKTDGYQMNQALLLSDSAQMNSKPELEIYADDVRCSHGATVGALDEEQLFYLRSRGIEEKQARALLISAFLNESLDLLENQSLRDYLLGRMNFHG